MYIDFHANYPLFLSHSNETLIFDTFSKNTQISNFMKIRPVGAELFQADRGTNGELDRHDEANSHF